MDDGERTDVRNLSTKRTSGDVEGGWEPVKTFDLDACRALLHEKDTTVRQQFLRRLHFDLFTDMSRYDAVLVNTDLIPEPTDQCAQTGIRAFAPVVSDVVHSLMQQARAPGRHASVQSLREKYGKMIQHVNTNPWSFA